MQTRTRDEDPPREFQRGEAAMTDRHLHILRLAVRVAERSVRDYKEADTSGPAASASRRERLARTLTRAKQHLAAAEVRRLTHRPASAARR